MNGHHGKDFSVEVFQAIEIGVVHANGFKIQISLVHEFRKPESLLIRRVGCRQEAKEKAMAGKNQASQREIERAINGGWWESGESGERQKESIYQLPTTKSFGQELDMRRGNVLGKKVRVQMLRDSQKTRNVKSSKTTGPEKK